jgi:hypothetical protein
MTAPLPKRRSRGFQFGLRKLLLWTAVAAVYLGVLSLVSFEPCFSLSLTSYLILVGIVRARWGSRVGCGCSVAVPLVPLLCLAGFSLLGIIGEFSYDNGPSGQAVEWCLGVLAWSIVCCAVGFIVFGCVELTLRAVDWADNLMETKGDGEEGLD